MVRGIDHLVLAVQDLEAARPVYEDLGFTTTPRAVHPFGTGNFLAQLQGSFLEFITVLDPGKIPPMESGRFSFAAFTRDFLAQRQGMSMLVFQSDDARADLAQFTDAGLTTYEPVDFSRQATLPDGTEVTVSFSLAFVSDARMPEVGFFCCQHHAPEYFWKKEYQSHDNRAQAVAEVIMIAEDPALIADFFEKVQGAENVVHDQGEVRVALGESRLAVMAPAGFEARFPGAVIAGSPDAPYFAGYIVAVEDLGRLEALLGERSVSFRVNHGTVWMAPEVTFGVVVGFSE